LVIDTTGGGTRAKYLVYPTAANTPAGCLVTGSREA